MYSGKRQKFDWVFALAIGDIVMVLASIFVSAGAQAQEECLAQSPMSPSCNLGPVLVYLTLVFLAMHQSGLYTWGTLMDRWLRPLRLIGTLALAGFVLCLLLFVLGLGDLEVDRWVVVQTVVALLLVWAGRLVLRWLMISVWKVIPEERIATVGWTPRLERVVRSLRVEIGRFQTVLGFFDTGDAAVAEAARAAGLTCLGGLDDIEKVHTDFFITLLVIDEASIDTAHLREVAAICSRKIINFRLIPEAFDILSRRLTTRVVGGVPLLGIQGVPLDRFHNRVAKRTVDIIGALVGLLFSGPVILLCMFLIKRESPGPAFYRQVRLGRAGKPFEIIKLRSMKLDAEQSKGAQWAVQDDPRRLKIGAFLRKTNLDETPQFWNVLKGEMSLVGPRPERPQFVDQFSHDVRHYNLRHSCKPGLSSWAAVHGLRGNTSLTERLDFDLYYFENWSLWLDFKTMFLTLMPPKNAY